MKPLLHPITEKLLGSIQASPSSYLFVGPASSGRRLAATILAARLNCPNGGGDNCQSCRSITAGSFADMHLVSGEDGIGVEQVQEVQQALAQRPFAAATMRIVILDTDHGITLQAQNRLLKTLEEPPTQTIIILLANHGESLLPTVRSRCRVINFLPPSQEALGQYLTKLLGTAEAESVIKLNPQSVGEAITLAGHPEERAVFESNLDQADRFLGARVFDRLVIAQGIKVRPAAATLLAALARRSSQEKQSFSRFAALETAQAELSANVSPRVVMEALALTL